MEFVNYNFSWIAFNLVLAFIPVVLTMILTKRLNKFLRILLLLFWFLFLPNTIYLVSDIQYLPIQFYYSDFPQKIALLVQYGTVIFFGFITYFYSLKPLEQEISKNKNFKTNKLVIITSFNMIIAFGVTLGKFIRIHSWFVFTNSQSVIRGTFEVLMTPKLILYFLLFGILVNLIYFFTNGYFKKSKRRR